MFGSFVLRALTCELLQQMKSFLGKDCEENQQSWNDKTANTSPLLNTEKKDNDEFQLKLSYYDF